MGVGRFIRRINPTVHTVETVQNIVKEKSVKKGLERTFREDFCEDNPLTRSVYDVGKLDGKEEGYVEASQEYESKLLGQAAEFLKQRELDEKQLEAYEQLLDGYESAISELEAKVERTEEENELLGQLLIQERQLRKLKAG